MLLEEEKGDCGKSGVRSFQERDTDDAEVY